MQAGQLLKRQRELLEYFRKGTILDSGLPAFRISRFGFESEVPGQRTIVHEHFMDSSIRENCRFTYPVFIPDNRVDEPSGILLLHGLNERNWDKYLCWAEYLALHTRKPVILFPIAFHMNRGLASWANPRSMSLMAENRRRRTGASDSLSFANAALSERLTEDPYRFYSSGRQTVIDITALARQISSGEHPLFPAGTSLNIFAYSIGSFLAEILLMANPGNLFSGSRLFVFCGGSIFRHMYGESRLIMDKVTYERLLQYYCEEWLSTSAGNSAQPVRSNDHLEQAFDAMITPGYLTEKRRSFFSTWKDRIAGISLRKDKVMPFAGVEACMGSDLASKCFKVLDFPFDYTHETPFPQDGRIEARRLDDSFQTVFHAGASFLR